jgi:hypothetical protein
VLNWSISRNYKEIWNCTKISVTPGMYLAQGGGVQRSLTSGPRGGRPTKCPGRPARFYVGLTRNFVHTCLHEKGKAKAVEKVDRRRTTWPAGHVARPAGYHLASYRRNQVGNPSLDPYKYPSTGGNQNTPHFGEWRVSEGQRASWPIVRPPHSSSAKALPESFRVRQSFSALVCLSAEALLESYGFQQSLCSSTLGEVGVQACQDHSASMPRIWIIYPS